MAEMTAEERLDKIANECLGMLEKDIDIAKRTSSSDNSSIVKKMGEALKTLADGLVEYRKAMQIGQTKK